MTIEEFIQSEEQKMTWWDNVTFNYPKVTSTKALASSINEAEFDIETIIRPSFAEKLLSIALIIIAIIVGVGVGLLAIVNMVPFFLLVGGLLFISFIVVYITKNSFYNKKYNYTLRITKEFIGIDSRKISWDDVLETCILNRQEGKRRNSYLVLLRKDNNIDKFDLFKFTISDKKLSAIIEFYKK